jgi:hypothetical protein
MKQHTYNLAIRVSDAAALFAALTVFALLAFVPFSARAATCDFTRDLEFGDIGEVLAAIPEHYSTQDRSNRCWFSGK